MKGGLNLTGQIALTVVMALDNQVTISRNDSSAVNVGCQQDLAYQVEFTVEANSTVIKVKQILARSCACNLNHIALLLM